MNISENTELGHGFGKRNWLLWLWLGLLGGALGFVSAFRALWDPGEGRYGEIAREMVATGDWLVPHLNFVRYFEKPPLGYWLNAASIKVFGATEFAVRLPTLLAAVACVIGAYWFAKRLSGPRVAALSAAVLATCAGFAAYAQIPELDMLLTALFCWGLWCFYAGFELKLSPRLNLHLSYALFSLGCLVKGPVSFVLGGAVIFWYLTLTRQWSRWRELYLPTGAALCALVTLPWFIAICAREPQFFDFFIIREHVQRFASKVHHRTGGWWYFLPVLAGGMFPWICALPAALKERFSSVRAQGFSRARADIFLFLWVFLIFAFFSVSSSKRPPYILLVFPPLAHWVAQWLSARLESGEGMTKAFAVPLLVLDALLGIAFIVAPQYIRDLGPEAANAFFLPGLFLLLSAAHLAVECWRKRATGIFYAVLSGSVIFLALALFASISLDRMLSRKHMAAAIMSEYKEGEVIISYDANYERFFQSMSFYTGRRVLIYGVPGELEFGMREEPRRDEYFLPHEQAMKLLQSGTRVYLIAKQNKLRELAGYAGTRLYGAPGPLSGQLVLVSNRPWSAK